MTTWVELSKWDGGYARQIFTRSRENTDLYNNDKRRLAGSGQSIDDFILTEILEDRPYKLTLNKYPYLLAPGIVHLVFWMREKMSISAVRKLLESRGISGRAIIIFENTESAKSVKLVAHYQVFIRVKK